MKSEIQSQLEQLAFKRTTPFCYGCYVLAPKGVCPECHSDDLMRHLEGVGVEWGVNWVIKYILDEELTSVDVEEAFEDMVRSCYPEETEVGWMKLDTVQLLKDGDPISWRCALSDYQSEEESEGTIMSFDNGSTYYRTSDIEELLSQE